MARDLTKTAICRIAAIRARSAYAAEKAKLVFEVREARKRGEDQAQFLATLERLALTATLLADSTVKASQLTQDGSSLRGVFLAGD